MAHVRNAHKLKNSNPDLARKLLKMALEIDPEAVEVYYMLGILEYGLDNYSEGL
jgi:lipoprotein NlpI